MIARPPRMSAVAAWLIVLAVVAVTRVAFAGDPTRAYRTVETDHFVIYYWAAEASRDGTDAMDTVARRVGEVAERAHRNLAPALDHRPDTKTIILIADDTDSANGFATVLPRNTIQLYATGPTGFNELADHDDWLYSLVAHEYTHILHLDTMEGLPNIYNSIFGKTWAPNQVMPRWVIEGIAVYEESKRSSGGRNRGSIFDQVIRIALTTGNQLRIDEMSGAPRRYPRSNAAYIYGSHFMRYIFDRFGDDKLREMSHVSGSYAPPFAINRQIAKTVGKPFTELYDDWMAFLTARYGLEEQAAERRGLRTGRALTHSAEGNTWPHYSLDGKTLRWVSYDGYTLPMVREMPVGGDASQARDVVQIDALGPFDLMADGSMVYEQSRVYRQVYDYEDIMRYDAHTQQSTRLTVGKRARDPAISPDERHVAFSMNGHSESVLAVMEVAPGAEPSIVWQGEKFDEAYQPAWSPDGTRIAFSAWRKPGYRDILIVEVASGKVEEVTRDRAVDIQPSWSADGKYIFFSSDRTGIANIYAWDTHTHATWQITNVLGAAFDPRASPDGTRMVYESAVPQGGYDLYEVMLDPATWQPARAYIDDRPQPTRVRDDEVAVSAPRPYRALETLAPQVWTAAVQAGASPSASLQTSGTDALGLHAYSLALGLDNDGHTNLGASYGYAGWRPTVRFAMARTLVERGGFKIDGVSEPWDEEDWSGTLSVGIPFEQRPSSSWSLSFDYDLDWFRAVGVPVVPQDPNARLPQIPLTNYTDGGVGVRLGFSNVRTTTFGLGPTNGFDTSVSMRIDEPALGSTYRDITVSYAFDAYQTLPWGQAGHAPPMFAMRLAGAARAGDLDNPGGFALGGVPPQDVAMSIVNSVRSSSIGYLRGYPQRTIVGNQYHLLNLEYRHELWLIEHGLATLPIYLRRLTFAGLTDVGTAFDGDFTTRAVRSSVGAALRLDAYFGYFVPGTFEIGYSKGLNASGVGETWFLLTGSL